MLKKSINLNINLNLNSNTKVCMYRKIDKNNPQQKTFFPIKLTPVIFFSVVKPKKKCVITNESTFSVTGFLTFAVVSATAVANVIANINNNNDNNNNNNNQDNVNNNNQNSDIADDTNIGNARNLQNINNNNQDIVNNINQNFDSADAKNMGNARNLQNNNLFCSVTKNEAPLGELEELVTSIFGYYLADQLPNFKHDNVPQIIRNFNHYC